MIYIFNSPLYNLLKYGYLLHNEQQCKTYFDEWENNKNIFNVACTSISMYSVANTELWSVPLNQVPGWT